MFDSLELSALIFVLLGTGAWILVRYAAMNEARRKLGGEIVEVKLYRRWAYILQRVLVGLIILLPVGGVLLGLAGWQDLADIWRNVVQSLWMSGLVFGMQQRSVILVGDRGMTLPHAGIVLREEIIEVRWDRDIGQQLWGVMIDVRKKGFARRQPVKHRLYVRRELKERVEELLRDRWEPVSSPQRAIAEEQSLHGR